MTSLSRRPLWKLLERQRRLLSIEDQLALSNRLSILNPTIVEMKLRAYRALAIELTKVTTTSARKSIIAEYKAEPIFAMYAAAAWVCRAFILAETFNQYDEKLPEKWAADTFLKIIDSFENQDIWLWPYEGERPWPDDDDIG